MKKWEKVSIHILSRDQEISSFVLDYAYNLHIKSQENSQENSQETDNNTNLNINKIIFKFIRLIL
jgi:hypothetical protein